MQARSISVHRSFIGLASVLLLSALSTGCGDAANSATGTDLAADSSLVAATVDPAGDAAFLKSLGASDEESNAPQRAQGTLRLSSKQTSTPINSLTQFEVSLPNTVQPPNPALEKLLLTAYLDAPGDLQIVKLLALYHLPQSLLNPLRRQESTLGVALEHTILSLYFVNRAKDLGASVPWIDLALPGLQAQIDGLFKRSEKISLDEYHPAHTYYRQVFHGGQEQNRYKALEKLLQDVAREPRDVYTSFALMTFNLWIGGEAHFDDPTILNNFVLGSFFQIRAFDMSHELELAWNRDPQHFTRFRMAAELGGFGLLERRWLAKVHGDQNAVQLIDEEHRQWWRIQPAIHSFSLGLPFFDEPEHFQEGFDVYFSAYAFCAAVPVRTCSNLPRFPFNLLSFLLGLVDFKLKAGDLEGARQLLNYRFDPSEAVNWSQWSVGRASWLHREDNLDAIFALYQNDNPADDPVNFETKRHKWGETTTVCQECHETQDKPQSLAEIEAPQTLPPPQTSSVGDWPPVTTAWYGASLRR